jgi:hypothetical protein
MRGTLEERFFAKIEHREGSDCWWWVGAKSRTDTGRGAMHVDVERGCAQATHISWFLFHGVWPNDVGLKACHNCPGGDNPQCVNPDHLFLGTQSENMRDCHNKRRCAGNTKLTDEQVAEVHRRVGAGDTLTAIAADFGITRQGISLIVFGRGVKSEGGGIYRPENDKRKKLSDIQVSDIRRRAAEGERVGALAREYGVRHSAVSRIIGGTRRQIIAEERLGK